MVVPVDRIWLTIWLCCELLAAWLLVFWLVLCSDIGYKQVMSQLVQKWPVFCDTNPKEANTEHSSQKTEFHIIIHYNSVYTIGIEHFCLTA
jgi:hypothetical protein